MRENEIEKPGKPLQRLAVITLAWFFILGGIAGLFLPIVPGGVLVIAGAFMLTPKNALLHRLVEKWRARFPFLTRAYSRFDP